MERRKERKMDNVDCKILRIFMKKKKNKNEREKRDREREEEKEKKKKEKKYTKSTKSFFFQYFRPFYPSI